MKIAVCQLDIKYEDKEYNLASAKEYVAEAKERGADMILFPEMSFTGFSMNTDLTGEDDDYTYDLIGEWASQMDIAIGFGWVLYKENSENHYSVFDNEGNLLGDYTKIHLFEDAKEDEHFEPGDEIVAFDYMGLNIGLSICYDLRFDDIYDELAGADVILVPANWPEARRDDYRDLLIERAKQYECYMIGINCCGDQEEHYTGDSAVVTPEGEVLFEVYDEEALEIVEI